MKWFLYSCIILQNDGELKIRRDLKSEVIHPVSAAFTTTIPFQVHQGCLSAFLSSPEIGELVSKYPFRTL